MSSSCLFHTLFVHRVDVERRIGKDEAELTCRLVQVVVVAADVSAVADLALQAVDCEVHAAQASGFVGFFDAVNGKFGGGVFLVFGDEARG